MKSSKQDWSSLRLKFFLQEEAEFKAVPKDIDGIHKLARYLLNKFISIRGVFAQKVNSNSCKRCFTQISTRR
jgi:hypothetical protein